MKAVKLIALFFAVTVVATVVARSDRDSLTNQNTTNHTDAPATSDDSLPEPVKSVMDHYLKIQAALADDSTNGITANALAISKEVKADKAKTLSSDVADAADGLAEAKDLGAARESFKDLSQGLIKYLSKRNIQTGAFDEVFCPMANAYWLQTNTDISNPYLGHSMPGCGEIKRGF